MRLIAPDYYPQFRCIADKCRHSCCIGWEIDIDPDTREKYRHVPGPFGERLNASIDDGAVSAFRLGQDERCPMLNVSGLCDLITALGEGALCQICADHPRFRNYFGQPEVEPCSTSDSDCLQSPSVTSTRPCAGGWSRTEIGLGLCCEEAARLILTRETPMRLIALEDDGTEEALTEDEEDLLAIRDTLICTMQDRTLPLTERLDQLLALGGRRIPKRNWAEVYLDLERLDPAWEHHITALPPNISKGLPGSFPAAYDIAFEQFCVHLLYRHIPGAMEDDDLPGRVAFCVLSTQVLMALCAADGADVIDLARMYSAEIEYDEDNIAALLDALWEDD